MKLPVTLTTSVRYLLVLRCSVRPTKAVVILVKQDLIRASNTLMLHLVTQYNLVGGHVCMDGVKTLKPRALLSQHLTPVVAILVACGILHLLPVSVMQSVQRDFMVLRVIKKYCVNHLVVYAWLVHVMVRMELGIVHRVDMGTMG